MKKKKARFKSPNTFHGKPIRDADEDIAITVAPRDIARARGRASDECAIAQACKRQHDVVDTRIGVTVAYVEYDDVVIRYITPVSVRRATQAIDQATKLGVQGLFLAGEYTLYAPSNSQRIGARTGTKPGSNKRRGKARTVRNVAPLRHTLAPAIAEHERARKAREAS